MFFFERVRANDMCFFRECVKMGNKLPKILSIDDMIDDNLEFKNVRNQFL